MLAEPPDCLLTTPESLEVLLVSTKIDHRQFFQNVRTVVIDELHAFAGDDRGWHLLSVLARIRRFADRDIQRIGLSATVGNPVEMLDWLSSGSTRDRQVICSEPTARTRPDVQLDYVGSLPNAAKVIRFLHPGQKRLVFCDSRSRVEQLAMLLRQDGVDTFVSHSSLGLDERRSAERAFSRSRSGRTVSSSPRVHSNWASMSATSIESSRSTPRPASLRFCNAWAGRDGDRTPRQTASSLPRPTKGSYGRRH